MRLINGIEMEQMKKASLQAKKEHEEKVSQLQQEHHTCK